MPEFSRTLSERWEANYLFVYNTNIENTLKELIVRYFMRFRIFLYYLNKS